MEKMVLGEGIIAESVHRGEIISKKVLTFDTGRTGRYPLSNEEGIHISWYDYVATIKRGDIVVSDYPDEIVSIKFADGRIVHKKDFRYKGPGPREL